MGMCLCLIIILGIEIAYIGNNHVSLNNAMENATPVWRFMGLSLEALWLWGICVWFYNRHRINYEFIFELDPRYQLTHVQILMSAAFFSVLYLVALDVYIYAVVANVTGTWNAGGFSPPYIHLILFGIIIAI